MRATRVIYVENDPALRGIMTSLLQDSDEIELILATGLAHEALDPEAVRLADVALIDLALGSGQMNGIDLGLAMRKYNDNIGIVIHSQYDLDTVARSVPPAALIGWSTLPKSGDMFIEDVVRVLRETAKGFTSVPASPSREDRSPLERMTVRQRAVMGMTASGINPQEIARRLAISHDAVRQDLSAAYRVLVPDVQPEDDLRLRAVFTYLELTRQDDAEDGT
jgi:two-component system, NarL family, response regulator DesR